MEYCRLCLRSLSGSSWNASGRNWSWQNMTLLPLHACVWMCVMAWMSNACVSASHEHVHVCRCTCFIGRLKIETPCFSSPAIDTDFTGRPHWYSTSNGSWVCIFSSLTIQVCAFLYGNGFMSVMVIRYRCTSANIHTIHEIRLKLKCIYYCRNP